MVRSSQCAAAFLAIACGDGTTEPRFGPAAKLAFIVQPTAARAGIAITPAVTVAVQDAEGRIVTTATHEISLSIGGGPPTGLVGTLTVTAVNGVARFQDLSVTAPGTNFVLTATTPALWAGNAISTSFSVELGPPTSLAFTNQPWTTAPGAPINPPVQVTVYDGAGNVVTSATNSITIGIGVNPGGGSLSGTTTVAASNGVATFSNLAISSAGAGYTLTAAGTNLAGATSVGFDVRNPLTFTAVTSGYFHSCGIVTGGAAVCWAGRPTPVAGGITFALVTAGRDHTCGVTPNGIAHCWGLNTAGTLGDGTTVSSAAPVTVSGGLTFSSADAGYSHSCGTTTAGTGYCWGNNASGQLGDGTLASKSLPAPVSGGLSFTSVSPGRLFSCGATAGGSAFCWGDNDFGMLGDGTLSDRSSPVPVSGGHSFSLISAGGFHACGLTTAGRAYCWGDNGSGQLGDGSRNRTSIPVPVAGGLTFTALSAGNRHTCGVAAGGTLYCWGDNENGTVGDGTLVPRSIPVAVSGGRSVSQVSAGRFHTCAVATDGAAYCWGRNEAGQLGIAGSQLSLVPVRVP